MPVSDTDLLRAHGTGLTAQASRGTLIPIEHAHTVTAGQSVRGCVFGPLTARESERLVHALESGDDPGTAVPEVPWAAAVQRADGSTVVACSTMLRSGVFWCVDGEGPARTLTVATDPGRAVLSRPVDSTLNHDYFRDSLTHSAAADVTPYLGLMRLGPGHTLRWSHGADVPTVVQWCGPDAWPPPDLEGPGTTDRYLDAFDEVTSALLQRCGTPIVALSGGLDSSFVAAGIARQTTTSRPVHGCVHAPLPEARLRAIGGWEPDETGLVHDLAGHYPGLIRVEPIINTAMTLPLDAAHDVAVRGWFPAFTPGNQIWLARIKDVARHMGESFVFVGTHGNASFSFSHSYAAPPPGLARRTLRMGRAAARGTRDRLLRRPDGAGAAQAAYARATGVPQDLLAVGAAPRDRASYLAWLAGVQSGQASTANPAAGRGVLTVDPFTARPVLDLAAAITPREWRSAPGSRGYARLLGVGRVPDSIRLRTSRGRQSWDDWYVMRDRRQRYLDEIDQLTGTPALGDWLDVAAVRSAAERLPWGAIDGQSHSNEVAALNMILSLADFARLTQWRMTTHAHDRRRFASFGR